MITNNGDSPQLLRNSGGGQNHWLEVRLIGTTSTRDAIGAKIRIQSEGGVQTDERKGGMSYQSAHDPRVHFGLGRAERVQSLEVQWPSGTRTTLKDLPANRLVTIQEGVGEIESHLPRFKVRQNPPIEQTIRSHG
jgi:enediyne biosynthesis protein E4